MSLRIQAMKYILIGIYSNIFLYCIYIFLTKIGAGHKLAMTFLYLIGMLQTYFLNKYWTFENRNRILKNLWRYILAYGAIYIINLIMLFYFVDVVNLNHVVVQGALIIILAIFLFLLQKYWVFCKE